jgi:hypothetical protein
MEEITKEQLCYAADQLLVSKARKDAMKRSFRTMAYPPKDKANWMGRMDRQLQGQLQMVAEIGKDLLAAPPSDMRAIKEDFSGQPRHREMVKYLAKAMLETAREHEVVIIADAAKEIAAKLLKEA